MGYCCKTPPRILGQGRLQKRGGMPDGSAALFGQKVLMPPECRGNTIPAADQPAFQPLPRRLFFIMRKSIYGPL